MSDRYNDLSKIPDDPVAKMLAQANAKIKTKLEAPASAGFADVMAELEEKGALVDALRVVSVMLPVRERVWWACLAARDLVGPKSDDDPAPLTTAETWVFRPTEENREAVAVALQHADSDDDTVNCAMGVLYCDGTLGPGEGAVIEAPAGAAEVTAFGMNMVALSTFPDKFEEHGQLLIDRALDIARGGSGQIKRDENKKEESA